MHTLLSVLLTCGGCGSDPVPVATPLTPAGFPVLDDRTASHHIQLNRVRARYKIGRADLPPETRQGDQFLLKLEPAPAKDADPTTKTFRAALPFILDDEAQRFAPIGMEVWIVNKKLSYTRDAITLAKQGAWKIAGRYLMVAWPRMPKDGDVRVIFPGVQGALDRHDVEAWGRPEHEFVQHAITLDNETRHGLTLPAPSKATWDVRLPLEAATFQTFLAMEPSPLAQPADDGAVVTLSVGADGDREEIDRRELPPRTARFEEWRVDLTAWAGRKVKIIIETKPRKHNYYDWVFLGSPAIWGPATDKRDVRRVVVIGVDTTRPDHFGVNGYQRDTTPFLDQIAEQSVVFDRAWSTAPRTRPSFRSATTGRIPPKAVGATNISEVFQRNGFATAGIVANVHLQPRFDFDHGFDWWFYDGKANAEQQVDRSLAWLRNNLDRDTYLFVHFMDPHLPYAAPKRASRFVQDPDPSLPEGFNRPEVMRWMKEGEVAEQRRKHIRALHDAELAYMDEELGRFYQELTSLPGRTLVVFHSDHGEEFWDHGGFEHNHTLYDEVTRTLLWLWPGGGLSESQRIQTPASLIDIAPTLYELLGFAEQPPVDGRSLVPLFEGGAGARWDRPIPLAYLQYRHDRWGVVHRDKKYILHTGSGHEELYDLEEDPEEQQNIASQTDLRPHRKALATAHDVPVRPGWRVRVHFKREPVPFSLALPAPCTGAGVMDPEALVEHRANLEWGEIPSKLPEDVGEVRISPDQLTVYFDPGPEPIGLVWVTFEDKTDAHAAMLLIDDKPQTLKPHKTDAVRWGGGPRSVIIDPGHILVPPPSEMSRMQALSGVEHASPEALELLKQLGYVQ